jgi:hypothetical protein
MLKAHPLMTLAGTVVLIVVLLKLLGEAQRPAYDPIERRPNAVTDATGPTIALRFLSVHAAVPVRSIPKPTRTASTGAVRAVAGARMTVAAWLSLAKLGAGSGACRQVLVRRRGGRPDAWMPQPGATDACERTVRHNRPADSGHLQHACGAYSGGVPRHGREYREVVTRLLIPSEATGVV